MRPILTDIRFMLRLVQRSPWFYGALIVVLTLGIGATTAMWSVVESVLLRPLPYDHPEHLTQVWATQAQEHATHAKPSIPDFLDWKAQATTFERLAAEMDWGASLASSGEPPEHLNVAIVSGDFFPVFRLRAGVGRLLEAADDAVDAPPVVVLSDALFRRRFHADPGVVGRSIALDARQVTVIGVAPPGFEFGSVQGARVEAWLPMATSLDGFKDAASEDARGTRFILVVGRRTSGASMVVAQTELSRIAAGLEQAHPGTNTGYGVFLEDLRASVTQDVRDNLWILLAAVAFVFAILCANITNLLLTRAQTRRGEMATRAAIGASAGRLSRQVLTETITLFLAGTLAGSLLAVLLVRAFAREVLGDGAVTTLPVGVDAPALALAGALSLACGLLAGLGPALGASRVAPQAALKESAARAGTSRAHARVRAGLVVAQIAVTCTLLIGTTLALRSFARLTATHPGFDTADGGYAFVSLPAGKYPKLAQARNFHHQLLERLRAEPGVVAVDGNTFIPMGEIGWVDSFSIEGEPAAPVGREPYLSMNNVTVGYFKTMGIPVLRGRAFTDADREGTRPVMMLSEAAAAKYFPGKDALGRRIVLGDVAREVTGIVGNVRQNLEKEASPAAYVPFDQSPNLSLQLIIRSQHVWAILERLPAIVASIDPDQAVSNRRLLTDVVASTVQAQRTLATLLAAFAAAALLLSTLGVFGLVSYATAQRTREMGIRRALGATPGHVASLVMGAGLRLVGIGLLLGLVMCASLATVLGEQTAHALSFDPAVYAVVPALLAVVSALACLLPARHAIRIPPAVALRYE